MWDSYVPINIFFEITFSLVLEVHLAMLISFTDLGKQQSWGDLYSTDKISPAKCKGFFVPG